ncbi:hypothetical protein MFIFM68171_11206 [Madurella fahalii]|uniref:Uncharacterized protein n=1 Tax=Madurella fahalii TaxID=1157608 RepID=A0ABQ0GTC1_9PEZI
MVMPACHALGDLLLGRPFLNAAKTLTALNHRVETAVLNTINTVRISVCYIDSNTVKTPHVSGYLHGEQATALPDIGSHVMLMLEAYARKRGFQIDKDPEKEVQLEFPDRSTAFTDGVVEDVRWAFGAGKKKEVVTRFYVLRNLPVDVILSNECVMEHDVFSRYGEDVADLDEEQTEQGGEQGAKEASCWPLFVSYSYYQGAV